MRALHTLPPTVRVAAWLMACIILAGARVYAADKPVVYAVNYPLKYFAERIGGDAVVVRFPAPSGEDPAFWLPDVKTIAAYQSADLILINGADYAKWLDKVSLSRRRMVDTSRAFRDRLIPISDTVTHSHGPTGKHAHTGWAFTTWLDFRLAVQQARAVSDGLARLALAKKALFQTNFAKLEADLLGLDRALVRLVARDPNKLLIGSHPVYQYLARRYGLNLKSVHWEPDAPPSANQWRDLTKLLVNHPAKWMIWEGKPLRETASKLAAMGVGSIVFDPTGNRPEDGDFMDVMRRNLKSLRDAYGKRGIVR